MNFNTHSIQIFSELRIENNFLSLRKGGYDTQIRSDLIVRCFLPLRSGAKDTHPFYAELVLL